MNTVPLMPITALKAKSIDELKDLALSGQKLQTDAAKNQSNLELSAPALGKVYSAFDAHLAEAKQSRRVPDSTGLSEFIRAQIGLGKKEKLPARPFTCAVVFRDLVQNGFLPESTYDYAGTDALDITGSIVRICAEETPEGLTHEAIPKVCAEVAAYVASGDRKERGATLRRMKVIRDGLKPAEAPSHEKLMEALRMVLTHLPTSAVFAETAAHAAHLKGDEAKSAYFAMMTAGELLDTSYGTDQVTAWCDEKNKAETGIQVLKGGTPVAKAA